MHFSPATTALALLATTVAGQQLNQTGPFTLQIIGKTNKTIDGYAFACHTGAAFEGLCYGSGPVNETAISSQFYFNYTASQSTNVSGVPTNIGTINYRLPFNSVNGTSYLFEPMSLTYQVNSNVAAPQFGPSSLSGFQVGFDKNATLFGYSYYDDSMFTAGVRPNFTASGVADYSFYLCWTYFTGYYYRAIGWAQTLPPHNPTCEPVDIAQKMLS